MVPAFGAMQVAELAPIFQKCALDVRERWVEQIKQSADGLAELNLATDCSFGLLNAIGEGS